MHSKKEPVNVKFVINSFQKIEISTDTDVCTEEKSVTDVTVAVNISWRKVILTGINRLTLERSL
jgi:hypothetical protein